MKAPVDLVRGIHETGQLPVVNFAAGGISTPSDAALKMQIGVDGVFVGVGESSSLKTLQSWPTHR
ncbi:MAG: hypothetical protein CM1200mP3_03130 [Chloroflexota bacterium]|nr:MAG: hypothetical protein CM1200mP3_03130 [Chloroflexota bacterium]